MIEQEQKDELAATADDGEVWKRPAEHSATGIFHHIDVDWQIQRLYSADVSGLLAYGDLHLQDIIQENRETAA
jgi:hypothetical protein